MNKPNLSAYREACKRAATDLYCFRQDGAIRSVTDTNTYEHGLSCRDYLRIPALKFTDLSKFQVLDLMGNPPLYDYNPPFNPTTLRHVVTALRIAMQFGREVRVAEIGCGYGALCAALQVIGFSLEYTLIDLPEPRELAREYLSALSAVDHVTFQEPYNFSASDSVSIHPSLVISCYALSELDRKDQDWYIDHLLLKADGAFLVMNTCVEGYTREEWLAKLPGATIELEIPTTHKDNYTLVWRNKSNG
jgi:hypothetical protein